MKRSALIPLVAAAAIGTLIVSGCTASGPTDGPTTEPTNEPVTITFMNHYPADAQRATIDALIAEFQDENPWITVINEAIAPVDIVTTFNTVVGAGDPPDVYLPVPGEAYELNRAGILTPVDWEAMGYSSEQELRDTFLRPAAAAYTDSEGAMFGVPHAFANYMMWVNRVQMDELGIDVPQTWEELCEAGPAALKKNADGQVEHMLLSLPTQDPPTQVTFLDAYVRSFGGSLYNADFSQSTLNTPQVAQAFQMLQRLAGECQAFIPEAQAQTGAGDRQGFVRGFASLMLTGGTWMRGLLVDPIVPPAVYATPWPEGPAGSTTPIYGRAYVVLKTTDARQAAAWRLVRFLLENGDDVMVGLGSFNGRADLAESQVLADSIEDWKELWLPSLSSDTAVLVNPFQSGRIADVLADAMTGVILGADVSATLEQAQRDVQAVLDRR